MMQGVHMRIIQNCHYKNSIQQGKDAFHKQTGMKFNGETIKVLHLIIPLHGVEIWHFGK